MAADCLLFWTASLCGRSPKSKQTAENYLCPHDARVFAIEENGVGKPAAKKLHFYLGCGHVARYERVQRLKPVNVQADPDQT